MILKLDPDATLADKFPLIITPVDVNPFTAVNVALPVPIVKLLLPANVSAVVLDPVVLDEVVKLPLLVLMVVLVKLMAPSVLCAAARLILSALLVD